jgi:hypothetical protein
MRIGPQGIVNFVGVKRMNDAGEASIAQEEGRRYQIEDVDAEKNNIRREYLLMRDMLAQYWRSAFNPNPIYSSSSAWTLFTLLWKTGKEEGNSYGYKASQLVQYLPEIKSVAGVKSFLEKASNAGFLEKEEGGDEYRLTSSTRDALNVCFDRSILECTATCDRLNGRWKSVGTQV